MHIKCVRKNGQIYYLCNNQTISKDTYIHMRQLAKQTNIGGSSTIIQQDGRKLDLTVSHLRRREPIHAIIHPWISNMPMMFEHLGDLSIAFIYSICQKLKLYHPNIFLNIIQFCTLLNTPNERHKTKIHDWYVNPYDSYKICMKNYYDFVHPIEIQFSEILNMFSNPDHLKYIQKKGCLLVEVSCIFDAGLLDVVVHRLKRTGLYAVAKSAPKIPIRVKIRTQAMNGTEAVLNTNPDHEHMNYYDWYEEELEIDLPELYEKRKLEYQQNNLCYIMVGRVKPDINNIFDKMEYMKKNHMQIPNQNGEAKLYLYKKKNYFAKHKRNRHRDIYDYFPIIKVETDHMYLRDMVQVTQVNHYAHEVAGRPQPIIFDPTYQSAVPFISRQIPNYKGIGALDTRLDSTEFGYLHKMVSDIKEGKQVSEEKEIRS